MSSIFSDFSNFLNSPYSSNCFDLVITARILEPQLLFPSLPELAWWPTHIWFHGISSLSCIISNALLTSIIHPNFVYTSCQCVSPMMNPKPSLSDWQVNWFTSPDQMHQDGRKPATHQIHVTAWIHSTTVIFYRAPFLWSPYFHHPFFLLEIRNNCIIFPQSKNIHQCLYIGGICVRYK